MARDVNVKVAAQNQAGKVFKDASTEADLHDAIVSSVLSQAH
jgi:hypothetical protein